ncbi:winged helix-turn-helix domain-containing protein [Candidatus Gottesmanbacteria bacterium]|nr:winged helix-turn-helix domain-containing protein [Candidatus Gottesmanbacteria bacterium]
MLGNLRLLVTDQYRQEATRWLKAIRRKESAAICFIPKTDRIIRVEQLFHDEMILKDGLGDPDRYHVQYVTFGSPVIEDASDLQSRIALLLDKSSLDGTTRRTFDEWMKYFVSKDRTLLLVVSEAEKLLTPAEKDTLTYLSYLIDQQYPRVLVVSCFEVNISHSSVMPQLASSTRLYANVFEYPLYEESSSMLFIDLLADEWGIEVSNAEKERIIKLCGGHFWLVKEAVRRISDVGSWSPEDDGMVFRLRTIYEQMLPSEQSALKKLVLGSSDLTSEERLSLAYLERMHFVKDGRCLISMMCDFVKAQGERPPGFSLVGESVYLNNVPVEKFFSRKEHRVIKLLVEHEGEVMSRNDIASALWPVNTEKEYSDWAIDQIIARVRKRLTHLHVSPEILKVIRGKGYLLSLSRDHAGGN